MTEFHLAQINIGKAVASLDSPLMEGFVSRLDEINRLAEAAPGFVWRLQSDAGDATSIRVFDDPDIIINMSVWTGPDALKTFVYRTVHLELLRGRAAWFKRLGEQHQAAWWIPVGHIPTAEEGRDRLMYLQKNGPTETAFTLESPFPKPIPGVLTAETA